ncbi:MAG: hypothetical protein R3199_11015 [Gemmatimonadota bacterium]|nr:hypothetical protein [Gemmatimonadota bacterium]
MRCDRAREAILIADPAELAGREDPALAAHLEACPRCREETSRVLEAQRELDRALSGLAARVRPGEAEGREADGTHPGIRRLARRAWIPAAAAAAVAAIVLLAREPAGPPSGIDASAARRPPGGFTLEPPPDRHVAVLEGTDPSVVVVWFYEPSTREAP